MKTGTQGFFRVAIGFVVAAASAGLARADQVTVYSLSDDASTAVTDNSDYTYTHAVDLNGSGEKINNVPFAAGGTSGSNYSSSGLTGTYSNYNSPTSGHIHQLLSDFYYNGSGGTDSITLNNLVVGQSYVTSFYNAAFGSAGGRGQKVTTSNGGSFSFDENGLPASRLDYRFTATSTSMTYTFAPTGTNASFHQYGFSNRTAGNLITDLFNTGVDSSHAVLPNGTVNDPHYTLVSTPRGSSQTLVRTSAGGFPIPPYLADSPTSAFIGPNNNSSLDGPPGTYDYQTTFTLPTGANPTSVLISGSWATDNTGVEILLNGTPIVPAQTASGFSSYSGFIIDGSVVGNDFIHGINTLDFLVNNAGSSSNPTALRVDGLTGEYLLPEPASIALLPCAGLLLLARRRRA